MVEVLIGQMVNLVRDGKPVRMSKRAGTVVTIEDLVEAVGVDAARYSLLRSSVDSAVDIDLDLISKRTNENPVFYVQYAHARLSSLQRNAASLGIDRGSVEDADLSLLTHEREGDLIRKTIIPTVYYCLAAGAISFIAPSRRPLRELTFRR